MTYEEMKEGFAQGRTLIQEEWSSPEEHEAIERLIKEGLATSTSWEYKYNFQCSIRRVTGVKQ